MATSEKTPRQSETPQGKKKIHNSARRKKRNQLNTSPAAVHAIRPRARRGVKEAGCSRNQQTPPCRSSSRSVRWRSFCAYLLPTPLPPLRPGCSRVLLLSQSAAAHRRQTALPCFVWLPKRAGPSSICVTVTWALDVTTGAPPNAAASSLACLDRRTDVRPSERPRRLRSPRCSPPTRSVR